MEKIQKELLHYLDGDIEIYYDTYYKDVIINYSNIISSDFNMKCNISLKNNLTEKDTINTILNSFKYELISKIFK